MGVESSSEDREGTVRFANVFQLTHFNKYAFKRGQYYHRINFSWNNMVFRCINLFSTNAVKSLGLQYSQHF